MFKVIVTTTGESLDYFFEDLDEALLFISEIHSATGESIDLQDDYIIKSDILSVSLSNTKGDSM